MPTLTTPAGTGIDGVSLGGAVALRVGLSHPEAFGAVGALQPAIEPTDVRSWADRVIAARRVRPKLALRLTTSEGDPYRVAVGKLSSALGVAQQEHDAAVLPGPHDYPFKPRSRSADHAALARSGAPRGMTRDVPWLVPLETLSPAAIGRRCDADRREGGAARVAPSAGVRGAGDVGAPARGVLARPMRDLSPTSEPRSLLRAATGRTGYARAAEARREISEATLPRGLESELHQLWHQQQSQVPWGLAVRSSATCEDGALVSLAGLAETRLGVRGGASLVEAVRAVWASVASGRALAYLAQHGVRDIGMAVVLQRMVRARAAGVMFTPARPIVPPTSRERIVNASLGLGANVVDGEITPRRHPLRRGGAHRRAGHRPQAQLAHHRPAR